MSQELINKLTDDLKPVCPMCPYTCFLRLLAVALLGGLALLYLIGLRPDVVDSLVTAVPYWKSGIFALIGTGALLSLCRLGVPGRGVGWVGPSLMTAGLAALIAFASASVAFAPSNDVLIDAVLNKGKSFCFMSVTSLGLLFLTGGFLVVRRFAYTKPALAGWLLGTASGAFAASAYAWHCMAGSGQALYIASWYSVPVVILGLIGLLAGPRFLRL